MEHQSFGFCPVLCAHKKRDPSNNSSYTLHNWSGTRPEIQGNSVLAVK